MIIETEIEISAPPMKVWRVLCDFAAYSKWNPYREVRGVAALDENVTILVGSDPERRHRVRAVIRDFDPGERLSFRTGNPVLSKATETFSLEPCRKGTRLRHTAEMTGLVVLILGRKRMEPRLTKVYQQVDGALAKYVSFNTQLRRPSRKDHRPSH